MTARTPRGEHLRNGGETEITERAGSLKMRVEVAEATAEAAERWSQRAEALAQWLLCEWRREHADAHE